MVNEVERYAATLRGAGCHAVEEQSLVPLIERASTRALERARTLNLWRGEIDEVVSHLRELSLAELEQAVLVTMKCNFDPFVVYAATTVHQGQYAVVGIATLWPEALGGVRLLPEEIEARLTGRSLGLTGASVPSNDASINAWLPFPVEEL